MGGLKNAKGFRVRDDIPDFLETETTLGRPTFEEGLDTDY